MKLRVGAFTRPFNEATADISYTPLYDARRRVYGVIESWAISGRVVLQSDASQSRMTAALRLVERDFNQVRPSLVFLEDDGITETHFKLLAEACVDGPRVINASFPESASRVYATGVKYGVDMVAERASGGLGDVIVSFQERVSSPEGGEVYGYVGGAINLPELQRFTQNLRYAYVQSGTIVGRYGYVNPPGPLWPQFLMKRPAVTKIGPEINGPVPMNFGIEYSYTFESPFELFGDPHILP